MYQSTKAKNSNANKGSDPAKSKLPENIGAALKSDAPAPGTNMIQRFVNKDNTPVQKKKSSHTPSRSNLPEDVKGKMEKSFGTDFSGVNIHTNDNSATDIGALAYTQGENVHFAPGQYDPGSTRGQELLGHELTHVIQQRQGRVKPGNSQNKGGANINSDKNLEKEADIAGAKAAQGQKADVKGSGSGVQKADPETHYTYTTRDRITDREAEEIRVGKENSIRNGATANRGDYMEEVAALDNNVEAVYADVMAGFQAQAGAFREAYLNYQSIMNAVNQRRQNTAQIIGVFMGFVAGYAGAMAESMMKKVCGRISNFVNIGVSHTDAIAVGLIDVMKTQISGIGGVERFETTLPRLGPGFRDPSSFKDRGESIIADERAQFESFIQYLTNNRQRLEGRFSPAAVLEMKAAQLAELQAGARAARSNVNTRDLELKIWESWIRSNGKKITTHQGYSGIYTTVSDNVPKEVYEHLQSTFGISEETVENWAGL